MLTIGLTGPSGAGKGCVSEAWKELGAQVIDCDAMYHEMLRRDEALRAELCEAFPEACDGTGGVERRKLAGIVFSDEARLARLNAITHAHITRVLTQRLAAFREAGERCVVLDAPTLFEAGADRLCDRCVAVLASAQLRAGRIARRDGIPMDAVLARFRNQHSDDFFREKCSRVLSNDGDVQELRRQAQALYRELVSAAAQ